MKWWRSIYQIDVETGVCERWLLIDAGKPGKQIWARAELTPDGKSLVYGFREERRQYLAVRNLESNEEKRSFEFDLSTVGGAHWRLSPDGSQLVIAAKPDPDSPTQIRIASLGGAEIRNLLPEKWGHEIGEVVWVPDGKSILFTHSPPDKEGEVTPTELWQVSVQGGGPRKLFTTTLEWSQLRIHPDGRRIAFSATEYRERIWVMENFLPSE